MSLSQPALKNPCHKFIEFKGGTGIFQYWKKGEQKGEGENVELKKPFKFIVLDELSTITGFNDESQSGVYSNEVHNLNDDILNVRTFKGRGKIVGKYADIKADIAEMGGRFTKSVYAALIQNDELELVNFQLKGISFKSWVDADLDKIGHAIEVEEKCDDGKKGRVEYKIPRFKQADVSKKLLDQAIKMDEALQSHLVAYKHAQMVKVESESVQVKEEVGNKVEDDDVPF